MYVPIFSFYFKRYEIYFKLGMWFILNFDPVCIHGRRGKQSLINSILIILEVGTNFVDLFYARVYIGHFYFCKIYLVTPK